MFLTIKTVNKDIKSEINFANSHVNNILRRFDSLANFSFTTSETKDDY